MASTLNPYNRALPILRQLKFVHQEPVSFTNSDNTEVFYIRQYFTPLLTRAGEIEITFKEGTQTKINRDRHLDVLSIHEFEVVITETGKTYAVPVFENGLGYFLEPLDQKIREIDDLAAKKLQSSKSSCSIS